MQWKVSRRSILSSSLGGTLAASGILESSRSALAMQQPINRRPNISLLDPPPPGLDPYAEIDPDHKMETVYFQAQDGPRSSGLLHLPKDGKTPEVVVVSAHPESDVGMDWRFPYYTRNGIAGMGIHHRYIRDDKNLIMEEVMLDMAAGIKYLKEERGFKRVVLLGHSGGGSTVCFYQSQAETRPPGRVSQTGSGDPPNLNEFDLPPADGMILSASHWGRGWSVMHRIDPSVTDEDDPLSLNPDLDMYNPANGFQTPPQPSRYTPEFVATYRAAQTARMDRLVAKARQLVAQQNLARELMQDPFYNRRSQYERMQIERAAVTEHIMAVYRKEANLKYTDLTLDPNDRIVGSNRGDRPDIQNYEGGFHPQPIKPRAFLSSESTASNVYILENIKAITVPILVMCGTADLNEWPEEQRKTYDAATARDKEILYVVGANHPYLPSGPMAGERNQRERASNVLINWISSRFL